MSALKVRSVLVLVVGVALLAFGSGCGKLKEMLSKSEDAGSDAAVVVAAPSAPVVAAPEDAGSDAAPVVQQVDDIPGPEGDDQRAARDIGFGNFKEELDKLEKEFDALQKKK